MQYCWTRLTLRNETGDGFRRRLRRFSYCCCWHLFEDKNRIICFFIYIQYALFIRRLRRHRNGAMMNDHVQYNTHIHTHIEIHKFINKKSEQHTHYIYNAWGDKYLCRISIIGPDGGRHRFVLCRVFSYYFVIVFFRCSRFSPLNGSIGDTHTYNHNYSLNNSHRCSSHIAPHWLSLSSLVVHSPK